MFEARDDDRLLKRAELVRLIGPSLNPDTAMRLILMTAYLGQEG